MVFLDQSAAGHAAEVSVFGFRRVEPRKHIVPLQNLHVIAMGARNIRVFLAAGLEVLANPATRYDQRRAYFEDFGKLNGARAIIRLRLGIACRIHLPFRQIVLHLEMDRHLRQRGRRIGTRNQKRGETVLAFLVAD